MTDQRLSGQSNQRGPLCKWCQKVIPFSNEYHEYLAGIDPLDKWGNLQLSQEEKTAILEAETSLDKWKREHEGYCLREYFIEPQDIFGAMSPRSLALSEFVFERLLWQGQMVCYHCLKDYQTQCEERDYSQLVH